MLREASRWPASTPSKPISLARAITVERAALSSAQVNTVGVSLMVHLQAPVFAKYLNEVIASLPPKTARLSRSIAELPWSASGGSHQIVLGRATRKLSARPSG